MNRDRETVKKWLDANQLALNIDKTNFVIFHSPQQKIAEQIIIKFMKKKIQRKISGKFLGVLLDSNLRWKSHITELSKKLSGTIGIFCKIRHFVPLEILKALYLLFTNWVQGPYEEIQAQGFSYSPSLRGLFGRPRACISSYGTSTQLVNSLLHDPF